MPSATSTRVQLTSHPFENLNTFWGQRGRWPAKWIAHPTANTAGPLLEALRREFDLEKAQTLRIHVSADERYELFLNGQRVGRGPERGDRLNWFFETYDLTLPAGKHVLVARHWWLSKFGPAPYAQLSVHPGFMLAAEGVPAELLNTGFAPWQAKILTGFHHRPASVTWFTGSKAHVVGHDFPWGYEAGAGDNWEPAKASFDAYGPAQFSDQPMVPILHPAMLPAMKEEAIHVGVARHVQAFDNWPVGEPVVLAADHLSTEANHWNALLAGQGGVTVPPHSVRRVIIDLQNYYCAYTDLITTGGRGSVVQSHWAEALYETVLEENCYGKARPKGNRDEIEGKLFVGDGDRFEPDGGPHRHFTTLWWGAGRYIELTIQTADEPLTIERFSLRQTHFPYDWQSHFEASDERLADVTPIAQRVMEMCSHETYMDCPYYEQLMYVGDTRLEVLITYAATGDDRLPRKALRLFDESRKSPGFTQSRYPSGVQQIIPGFSAWWVAMVHDFAMWRDDPAFVRSLLPGVRAVLDTFTKWKTQDGLIAGPTGWNFMDWVPAWKAGMPPDADTGISAPLNFKLAWVYQQAAQLEDHLGEPELADLQRRRSSDLVKAAIPAFWDESRGLLADDMKHQHFSEHTQCMALLGNLLDTTKRPRVIEGLFTADDLARTTVYFSHYLFEACRVTGRMDRLFERLQLWFDMKSQGFKTTLETPEPSRSDCHAWGAHPLFHFYATILGVRPATPGFGHVNIRPQLGPLAWAKGTIVHPKGEIEVDVKQSSGKLSGHVKLPAGVTGSIEVNGQCFALASPDTAF